jgi:hypothetical protein
VQFHAAVEAAENREVRVQLMHANLLPVSLVGEGVGEADG